MILTKFQQLNDWLQSNDTNQSQGEQLTKRILNIFCALYYDLQDQQLTFRAMGLAYTTLLSLVPLLALSFSVLKAFGVHNQIEPLLLNLMEPLGDKGIEITSRLLEFVDNIKVGILGALGLIMLLYTVVSLMQKIENAFNYTWRVSESRDLVQRFSHYLSVLLIGPVLIFSAVALSASLIDSAFVQSIIAIEPFGTVIHWSKEQLPRLLIILAFIFVYLYIPNTQVNFSAALIGAIIAGLLWQGTGWAFASFVVTSAKHTAIYSAFATLLFFMIWMYLGWLILLIGASIAFYSQNPEYTRFRRRNLVLNHISQEKFALLLILKIGQRFYNNQKAYTLSALCSTFAMPEHILKEILNRLIERGLIIRSTINVEVIGMTENVYLPAKPWDETPLFEVLVAIRQKKNTLQFFEKDKNIEQYLFEMEINMKKSFNRITLKQFVKQNELTI